MACLGRQGRRQATERNHSDLTPNQIGGQRRQSIVIAFRPAKFELARSGRRCSRLRAALREAHAIGTRPDRALRSPEVTDHGHLRLLRARGERPSRRTAEQADEMSPVHGPIIAEFASEGAFRPRPRCRKLPHGPPESSPARTRSSSANPRPGRATATSPSSRGRDAGRRTGSRISPARPSRSTAGCRSGAACAGSSGGSAGWTGVILARTAARSRIKRSMSGADRSADVPATDIAACAPSDESFSLIGCIEMLRLLGHSAT